MTITDNIQKFRETVPAACIEGACGTGKTTKLVREIDNAAPTCKKILVLCATPQSAVEMTHRIGTNSAEIVVCTARDEALRILSTKDAQDYTKRKPHIASPLEEVFIMEDMKTCGIRPQRLREMLKFFYRSWTEMADNNPDWLLTGEESNVHALLKNILAYYQVLLEPEVGNLAVSYLLHNPSALQKESFDQVFVDDAQMMNRSSQLLAHLLARTKISMTWDTNETNRVFDSYPYAKGDGDMHLIHRNVEKVHLTMPNIDTASFDAAQTVLQAQKELHVPVEDDGTTGTIAFPDHRPEIIKNSDFIDELKTIESIVQKERIHANGQTDESNHIRIAIASPNDVWTRNIAGSLQQAGIHAHYLLQKPAVIGDVRDTKHCLSAMILCALQLVAQPTNAMAWRMWVGFGNYLTNSNVCMHMRMRSMRNHTTFLDELENLASINASMKCSDSNMQTGNSGTSQTSTIQSSEQRVIAAYIEGKHLIDVCAKLQGSELLQKIVHIITQQKDADIPSRIIQLCSPNLPHATAVDMYRRSYAGQTSPVISKSDVAIFPYTQMAGISPDVEIIAGFNNGFFPSRDFFDLTKTKEDAQQRIHEAETHMTYMLFGKACKKLIISWVSQMELESAEAMNLKIKKISYRDNTRVCTLTPSIFIRSL